MTPSQLFGHGDADGARHRGEAGAFIDKDLVEVSLVRVPLDAEQPGPGPVTVCVTGLRGYRLDGTRARAGLGMRRRSSWRQRRRSRTMIRWS